jgi:hypothetical protein
MVCSVERGMEGGEISFSLIFLRRREKMPVGLLWKTRG